MTAAISRMMRVTSCRASHTSWRNVLGFLGGMKFFPNEVWRFSRSTGLPERPAKRERQNYDSTFNSVFYILNSKLCVCVCVCAHYFLDIPMFCLEMQILNNSTHLQYIYNMYHRHYRLQFFSVANKRLSKQLSHFQNSKHS